MRERIGMAIAAALMLASPAGAVEVIDLRLGLWETVFKLPDGSTQKDFTCRTQEELESLRFFISMDENCKIFPGSQSRTEWEATAVCGDEDDSMSMHVLAKTTDPMNFTSVIDYDKGDQHAVATGTARWLQESCNISDIPIS